MGAHAVGGFQMFGVHQQTGEFVLIFIQPEKNAETHIVDAAFHSAVHGFGVIIVIMFGAGGMKLGVAFLMVRFLKQNVGADARVVELLIVFHGGGGDVHIDTADGAVFMLNPVNGLDAFQNIFDGVVFGIFPGFNGQPFMPHILQRDNFFPNLFLGQLFTGNIFVLAVIGAVDTAVDAVIGKVQRRENNDAVAVIGHFDLFGQIVHLADLRFVLTGQQNRGFPMAQPFVEPRFFQNAVDQLHIVFVFFRVIQGVENFLMIDKFIGAQRFGIILETHRYSPSFRVKSFSRQIFIQAAVPSFRWPGYRSLPFRISHMGIDRFGRNPRQTADLSGKGVDHIVGSVHGNADDAHIFFFIGNAHAADDITAVIVENRVEFFPAIRFFHDHADQGNSCFHREPPQKKYAIRRKKHRQNPSFPKKFPKKRRRDYLIRGFAPFISIVISMSETTTI